MKGGCRQGRSRQALIVFVLCAITATSGDAAQLKQARVSQVVRDVKLLPERAAPRPAQVDDDVREKTAVRTGLESRAELTFTDATLARLGANTIFSFSEGTRNLELGGGAMLLRVPKNVGGAQINTAAITAAITGTTIMLEYHPNAYCKFIVLEGIGRIFRKGHLGESVLVHAGQMLIVNPNGTSLPEPVDVDLERLMKTSVLITGFPPLLSLDLIDRQIEAQNRALSEGGLINTNLVIFGAGTAVSLLDPTNVNLTDQANANETRQPSPTPTATPVTPPPIPTKTGTPIVISSPVPYLIGSGTTMTTDPAITTNGITDFGKQYRSPDLDGSPSAYLFGSTSAFDSEIGFDEIIGASNRLPSAVFKFAALQLTGNPTIVIGTDNVTSLALVSVGDITSAAPGGALTFDGIDAMLLATEDGSITLGSEISFEGIPDLFIYARGTGSTLTLDSAISGTATLTLVSEGDILFNNAFNLTEGEPIDNGLKFSLVAGTNLTAANDLTITLDNSNGGDTLDQSARISLIAGQNLTVGGETGLNLTIANNGGGHIGGDATIGVFPNGNLTASAINLFINDRDAGIIDGEAAIFLDVVGALNVDADALLLISTRNDGLGGGMVGSDAFLNLEAASIFTGGSLTLDISTNAGGVIPTVTLNTIVSGGVVANGGFFSEIENSPFNVPGGPFIQPGTITGNAFLLLTLGSVTSGAGFEADIFNLGEGAIGGEALVSVGITGNLNNTGDVFADIFNFAVQVGETIFPGGTIDGSASVVVGVGGDFISSGVGQFAILNNDQNSLSEAGTIMGDAFVSVSAINITTGGFFRPLINNTNGVIDGNATVLVTATGDISVGAEMFFNSLNTNGTIGTDALSTLTANNFTSGSTFQFQILNDSGNIGSDVSLTAAFSGTLTSIGDAFIQIVNPDGTIGSDALIDLTAANLTANSSLFVQIDNIEGRIDGSATIDSTITGTAAVSGNANFNIFGSDPAGGAAINFNGGAYNVGGTFRSTIDGNGTITFNNASINADILKSGVFGANGTLTVGGGTLSGNTELKLYAPGSNGSLNFISNVTLNSESNVILAANAVTINNGVVVTITGDDGADAFVFTNVPNYTGFGGNGTTTGTFDGNGAQTFPLDQAPPFDDGGEGSAKGGAPAASPASTPATLSASRGPANGGGGGATATRGKRRLPIVRVADSNELLDLANKVTSRSEPGRGGSRPAKGVNPSQAGSASSATKRFIPMPAEGGRDDLTADRSGARRPAALP